MSKLISIFSIFAISTSQLLASTFKMSNLSQSEQEAVRENYDNDSIKYDESTDEVVIDEALERELRESGILKTESVKRGVVSEGGGWIK